MRLELPHKIVNPPMKRTQLDSKRWDGGFGGGGKSRIPPLSCSGGQDTELSVGGSEPPTV